MIGYYSLKGASSPDITTVYVDRVSLRNDRVNLLERGSPNSLCLMESGKVELSFRALLSILSVFFSDYHKFETQFNLYGPVKSLSTHYLCRLDVVDVARFGLLYEFRLERL